MESDLADQLRKKQTGEIHHIHPRYFRDCWGCVHYAFTVPREKLEEAVSHVRKHDVDVYGPGHIAWMNARVYYFYDRDGNLLEFWSTDNA